MSDSDYSDMKRSNSQTLQTIKDSGDWAFWWNHFEDKTSVHIDELVVKYAKATGLSLPNKLVNFAFEYLIKSNTSSAYITEVDWAAFLSAFGPFDHSYINIRDNITDDEGLVFPWFHGWLSEEERDALLTESDAGMFLVHMSHSGIVITSVETRKKSVLSSLLSSPTKLVFLQQEIMRHHQRGFALVESDTWYPRVLDVLMAEFGSTKKGASSQLSFIWRLVNVPTSHPAAELGAVGQTEVLTEWKRLDMLARVRPTPVTKGNLSKDRYENIRPSTAYRVLLKGQSDYINACHVSFRKNYPACKQRYICTQAPVPQSIGDFWRMVWEQKATLILMITRIEENKVQKANQYWPNEHLETVMCGSVLVTASSPPQQIDDMILRKFTLRAASVSKDPWVCEQCMQSNPATQYTCSSCQDLSPQLSSDMKNHGREVTQLQYVGWPDHGVPDTFTSLTRLLQTVRDHRSSAPIIAHCSAGVGRTGTTVCIDAIMQHLDWHKKTGTFESATVDIYQIIAQMRWQRPYTVQTPSQYFFIYNFIVNYINLLQKST